MPSRNNRSPAGIAAVVFLIGLACVPVNYLHAKDSSGSIILRDRLEEAVRQHVVAGFNQAGLTGELVAIHLPPNVDAMDPAASLRPFRSFLPSKAAGRYVIPIEVTPEGGTPVKVNITVECVAVIHGWAARFPLKRGVPLEAEQFQRKKIRVTRREQDYYTVDSLPEGYQLCASLARGRLLQYHHLEEVPMVRRGEQVMIHFRRRNLILVSPGKTRREGNVGDLIPVVASVTGKRLFGRLVSPGIVVVE